MRTPRALRVATGFLIGVILSSGEAGAEASPEKSGANRPLPTLQVSPNGRYLQTSDGAPFFWTADTGWLAIERLSREEIDRYFKDREAKGFNVVQVMIVRELPTKNFYGATPFAADSPGKPLVEGNRYDFWSHVDYFVDEAAKRGIYAAMVPAWGNAAKKLPKDGKWAIGYAVFLAKRYGKRTNVVWLNGGDLLGSEIGEVWENIGSTLDEMTTDQLITFHPRGRASSSTWFHGRRWLDFNMFQSGHRAYDQRREGDPVETWKGEDNWKYVEEDLALRPQKPTIDGEPSYEDIPHGLHNPKDGYWTASDVRRYEYWSVFAGSFGATYGHNAVFQMHKPDSGKGFFSPRKFWYEALDDPGARQMRYLKELMLSRSFFDRVPDQSLVAGANGARYERVVATRGKNYVFLYTYTGRPLEVVAGKIAGDRVKASWFNPRDGKTTVIGDFRNSGTLRFQPPGRHEDGNDWVLILDSQAARVGTR